MKCLSVHQPWADLIVSGKRTLEIRKWGTQYRGPLLIHAGLRVEAEECKRLSVPLGYTGFILGFVELSHIKNVSAREWSCLRAHHLEAGSRCYGAQTFAWFLRNAKRFARPIPYKGRLGLFEVPDHLMYG